MKYMLGVVLALAVSGAGAVGRSSVSAPGATVFSSFNMTPDANVTVMFHDQQGCEYYGKMVRLDDEWVVPVDRKKCPSALYQAVSMIVPLGGFSQPICAGKELGMFETNVPLPEGRTSNPDDLATHLLQAWAACS
ncbi:hypothetical protein [Pseudomonas cannabina]|uniref:hypothetical protein n=1 Tax=Pseudomonas cannabina TaxID=86840 RepID=UPI000F004AD5|nr:hypothetical protein [Pseudomonas cannabina]